MFFDFQEKLANWLGALQGSYGIYLASGRDSSSAGSGRQQRRKQIQFRDLSSGSGKEEDTGTPEPRESSQQNREDPDIVVDPLTGDPIPRDDTTAKYLCCTCNVLYLEDSFLFLKEHNEGKCVHCNSTNIILYRGFPESKLRIATGDFVKLEDLPFFVDKKIVFKGKVVKILESRRSDYALMFEDKPWVEGFKIVVFYTLMTPRHGLTREFLQSLVGKTIIVKGILKHHAIYGYEILVFSRKMIEILD